LLPAFAQCFWFVPLDEVWRVDYRRYDYMLLGTLLQQQQLNGSVEADSGPLPSGIFQQGASP
jgi:hypothetical protein